MDLKLKSKSLLNKPGVYLMKDSLSNTIYVGKSKNLKNRVSSYFLMNKSHSEKVKRMVLNVKDFQYVYTDTEIEALLLENMLIKRIRPRYNRLLKNEERYNYIKITMGDEYPIIVFDEEEDDTSLCIGPFTRRNLVIEVTDNLNDILSLRKCKQSVKKTVCSYYAMKKCLAPCKYPCKEEYYRYVNMVKCYFHGDHSELNQHFDFLMKENSEALNFEKAMKVKDLKDKIFLLYNKYAELTKESSRQVSLYFLKEKGKIIKIFMVKNDIMKFMYSLHRYKNFDMLVDQIYEDIGMVKNQEKVKFSKEDLDEINIINYYLKNNEDIIHENVNLEEVGDYQSFKKIFLKFTN